MDLELDAILSTISNKRIRTLDEINYETKTRIENCYKKYLNIPKNVDNLKIALDKLEDYEYKEYDDLDLGDYVMYINSKYFYDIELKPGGFLLKKDRGKVVLKNGNIFGVRSDLYFKKITDEEKAKMILIGIIKDEKIEL